MYIKITVQELYIFTSLKLHRAQYKWRALRYGWRAGIADEYSLRPVLLLCVDIYQLTCLGYKYYYYKNC